MPVLSMFSRSMIDNSRSIIDDSRVMLQLVASYTILIYDDNIFILYIYDFRLL
jgi:hypothetical protein